ncbi:MAG: hypothetical protein ACXAB8_03650 [Promethearchaeota archaeon]
MCKNCNCDFFDRCSIVGYMPVGFCCENCFLHDEYTTCLKSNSTDQVKIEEKTEILGEIKIISTSIEKGLLKIVIKQDKEKERTLLIDLKKYLET